MNVTQSIFVSFVILYALIEALNSMSVFIYRKSTFVLFRVDFGNVDCSLLFISDKMRGLD